MKKIFTAIFASLLVLGSATAMADSGRGYRHHNGGYHHDRGNRNNVAGALALGLIAGAIASNSRDERTYYDYGYQYPRDRVVIYRDYPRYYRYNHYRPYRGYYRDRYYHRPYRRHHRHW